MFTTYSTESHSDIPHALHPSQVTVEYTRYSSLSHADADQFARVWNHLGKGRPVNREHFMYAFATGDHSLQDDPTFFEDSSRAAKMFLLSMDRDAGGATDGSVSKHEFLDFYNDCLHEGMNAQQLLPALCASCGYEEQTGMSGDELFAENRGMTENELFAAMDTNNDGQIDAAEYAAANKSGLLDPTPTISSPIMDAAEEAFRKAEQKCRAQTEAAFEQARQVRERLELKSDEIEERFSPMTTKLQMISDKLEAEKERLKLQQMCDIETSELEAQEHERKVSEHSRSPFGSLSPRLSRGQMEVALEKARIIRERRYEF